MALDLWPLRRFVAVVAGLSLSSALVAQDSVHFPPAGAIVIRVMRDVPAAQLTKGFLGRTVVGATGSFTFAEFDDGAGAPLHHHEREQVNVGIEGVMLMALGTHTEPLPVGAAVITPANVRHAIRNLAADEDRWKKDFYPAMVNRAPDLHDVTEVQGWAGLYEMTPDHNPVLGPHPGLAGFIFANGFSGHGLMMSPATGKIVSEFVRLGRSEMFAVAIFAPDRFARGALIHDAATI